MSFFLQIYLICPEPAEKCGELRKLFLFLILFELFLCGNLGSKEKVGWKSASRIRIDNKTELAVPDIPLRTEIEARLLYNDDDQRAQGHIIHRSGDFEAKIARAVSILASKSRLWLPLAPESAKTRPSGDYAKFLAR